MAARSATKNAALGEINISDVLTLIIQEIITRSPDFRHISLLRMLVCIASNKSNGRGAIYGKVVPLRFRDGAGELYHHGKRYTMPVVMCNGISQLYLIYFYFPKFFDLPAMEKLRVVFHELYHINPLFNGDIRRMGRVRESHGSSRKNFDRQFEESLQSFCAHVADTPYMNFLMMDTAQLARNFSIITARRMKVPRPIVEKADQNT